MTKEISGINFPKFIGFAALASILNVLAFFVGKAADASMVVDQGGLREIAFSMVLFATFVPLLLAGGVTNLIGKKNPGFISKAAVIGGVFGVATFFAPFLVAQDGGTGVTLASNHVIAGVLWYIGIKKSINS
jgi:hypothetical protein